MKIGDRVRFRVIEETLGGKPTGRQYDEVGTITQLEKYGTVEVARVQVRPSCYYVVSVKDLKPEPDYSNALE